MIYQIFFSLWFLQLSTVFSFGSLNVEPKCSRFDFEEKLLEKVVKMEHTSGLMSETFKSFSTEMKTDLQRMKDDFEEIKAETKKELARLEKLIEGKLHFLFFKHRSILLFFFFSLCFVSFCYCCFLFCVVWYRCFLDLPVIKLKSLCWCYQTRHSICFSTIH